MNTIKVRSLLYADMNAKKLVKRLQENGSNGCVIADKNVLTAIEDFRAAFNAADMKLVPGCTLTLETEYGKSNIVVIAKNDKGYTCLSKLVTAAQKNGEVLTETAMKAIVKKYGNVAALSGRTVITVLQQNAVMQEAIDGYKRIQSKCYKSSDAIVENSGNAVTQAEKALDEATVIRDEEKFVAEKKYSKRQAAAKKAGDAAELEKISAEMEESNSAKMMLPTLNREVSLKAAELKRAKEEYEEVMSLVRKYEEYEEKIQEASAKLKSEEEVQKAAAKRMLFLKELFGEFYVEIQNHGTEEEQIVMPKMVALAKKFNLPMVITNDACMLDNSEEERLKRRILRSVEDGDRMLSEEAGDEHRYVKSDAELVESALSFMSKEDAEKAIQNFNELFNACDVKFKTGKHYPKASKNGEDSDVIFDNAIKEGVARRFPVGMDAEHQARLEYEIGIIKKMGYVDYHLIVMMFIEYGRLLGYLPKEMIATAPLDINELREMIKKNGWKNPGYRIGSGRGSAVGSLVCFCLGITNLDPIKYGLLFERFLNPDRISMPDIDTDISATSRQRVIEYVKYVFGESAVRGIMTVTTQGPKSACLMAAKYYGLEKYGTAGTELGKRLSNMVPDGIGIEFSSEVLVNAAGQITDSESATKMTVLEYMRQKFAEDKDALEALRWASILEGSFTAYGAHAAGIVISDNDDVSDYLPLRNNDGQMTTMCDMVQVEENGLLKFDFLGLKTCDIITEAVMMIEKNYGVIIDTLNLNIEDAEVYEKILCTGRTNAVFQFESDGMKSMLKRFKPQSFEDLIILVSMFRPGPLQYLDGVIDVKNGKKPMTFLCPQLKDILGATYGAIVYQEQVMVIFQKLAGYTFGQADLVRRYMSKKKADKLAHEKEAFINGDVERGIAGCVANGIDAEIADTLFEQMTEFAKYAFNKSHAAAYAYNAYITAWLKLHYTAEFFAAALNWAADNTKIAGLMREASALGVKCLAPDVVASAKEFTAVGGQIRFGLSLVAGVRNHADDIIEARKSTPFVDFKDFFLRVNPNSTVIGNLIRSGACDCFHNNRESILAMVSEITPICKTIRDKNSFVDSARAVLPMVETASAEEIIGEQKRLGLHVDIKESTTAAKLEKRIQNAMDAAKVAEEKLSEVFFHRIKEDKMNRMKMEKDLLGIYVTEHPMDFYPAPADIDLVSVSNLDVDSEFAYGIITNMSIKYRKSDGKPMAFFTLEDRTGSIECAVFTKAYVKLGAQLAEGKVVTLSGKMNVSGDGEDVKTTFFVEGLSGVKEKAVSLMMEVPSYAQFHMEFEEGFRKEYEASEGFRFLVLDKAMNEVREMTYNVSEKVKLFANVVEV